MGSSASKSARRLPTSTQSSLPKLPTQPIPSRSSPSATSHESAGEHAELDETYSRTRDLRGNAPRFQQSAAPGGGSGAGARAAGSPAGQGRSAGLDYGLADQGAMPGSTGKAQGGFSGEKDDGQSLSAFLSLMEGAVLRDAQDPQFMANLSRLGQVQIHDAGKFVKAPALAQRTLSARSPLTSSPTQIPPHGHLTAPLLINLLDKLKTVPPSEAEGLYKQFNMTSQTMQVLRGWVNSPSVGEDEVRVEEGERIVEMKAVWVGPKREEIKRIA